MYTYLRSSHKSLDIRHHKRQHGVKVVVDDLLYALPVGRRNIKLIVSYLELHFVRILLGDKAQYNVTEDPGADCCRNVFLIKVE